MALKPWSEVCPEPLAFPIGGKVYVVPELGKDDGIKLQYVLAGKDHSLDGEDPEVGWRLVMGPVWDEMAADGVSSLAMSRAAFAALADLTQGRAAAEKVWESGIDPEALAAAMAATQTNPQTRSSSTAAVTKTRSRASTSGTRTSRKNSPAAKARASRS